MWEYKIGQQLWKNLVGPQKVKQKITKKLHNFPLGIYPKELKTRIQENTYTPIYTGALFTTAKR